MPVDSDRDVFRRFTEGGSSRAVALLAFASYAEAKYDWEAHHETRHGKPPTAIEVERWIRDQSDARLDEIQKGAVAWFAEAANAYMTDQIEAERQQAVAQSILSEVNAIRTRVEDVTSFRATFWLNLFVGVVASFVFAFIIIGASLIFNKDPSPFSFFKKPEPVATVPAPPAKP